MKSKATYGQHRRVLSVMVLALVLTLVGVPSYRSTATADAPPIILPAGLACADFGLQIDMTGGPWPLAYKEFRDEDGNLIRILAAGKGWNFLFTNLETGATFSLKGNGSVSHYSFNPDGTYTYTATGHNIIIFFPTDEPPGPSTKQYIGRIVYAVDTFGNSTVQELSGRQIDICAALSN